MKKRASDPGAEPWKELWKHRSIKDITVDIYKGDVVFVVGPSGSGKSTFLRCLNRLEEPTKGHIYFEGTDITDPKTDIDKHRQKWEWYSSSSTCSRIWIS